MNLCNAPGCSDRVNSRGLCNKHYKRMQTSGTLDRGRRTYTRVPLAERFWPKVRKTEACWLWTGTLTPAGYGLITRGGVADGRVLTHRLSWELLRGPIPPGMHLDHLCRVPACCNPDHLEPVTPSENTRRGYAPPISGARQRAKTHCNHGHLYDEANTHVNRRGARVCRTCMRLRGRATRDAKRTGLPYVSPFAT